ncbi:MAG: hypothetical protein V4547_18850 [Bacteroidota bacterium]
MLSNELSDLHAAIIGCNESTLFFTRYFFKQLQHRKYVIGEHHRIISDALDKVIKGEIKRLIINIAPRYGKTELAVKNFIAHGLSINPAARFIHLSYSDDLALDNSEAVKEIVKDESFQLLYPHIKIKQGSDSKKKWYTTENGGVYATSAAGQVTGFGAGQVDDEESESFINEGSEIFGGALIIDDPIKPEDGDSDVARDRINQRYDSTIKNRVNSRNTPIIIIMQRVHENDICGYLMEKDPGEWTVLSLPCIKQDGTPLWEFKHTIEELNKLKKDNEVVFERQYMQDPKPLKGLMFPASELRYFIPDPLRKFESSIAYADIADEGEDNLSAPIGKIIGQDIYIPDVVFARENSETTIPMVAKMLIANDVRYIRVESNSMGAMYARELQKELKACKVLPAFSGSNKFTRIFNDSHLIKKHCLFVHPDHQTPQYKVFFKELTSYLNNGKSKKDDAPDSVSGLIMFIRSMLPNVFK